LHSYPLTKFGTQNCAFIHNLYKTFKWLEYSVSKDSIFCFACRNYSTGNSGNFEDGFLVGFRNWKKACALYLCFIYNFFIIIINISIFYSWVFVVDLKVGIKVNLINWMPILKVV
jgi:hypothetical protein